ncbi:MAG: hypothetical protein ACOYT8_01345 [Candidatus Dependentiae bacterium]
MSYVLKIVILVSGMAAFNIIAMSKSDLIKCAGNNNAEELDRWLTPEIVNMRDDDYGYSLLAYAISGCFEKKNINDFIKTLAVFKKNNVDFNAPVKYGIWLIPPLLFAAGLGANNNDFKPVEAMIEAGANPHTIDGENRLIFDKLRASSTKYSDQNSHS